MLCFDASWLARHGLVWHREIGLGLDPNARLQKAIRLIFERFRMQSRARQVRLSMISDGMHFTWPSDGKKMVSFDWTPIPFRNVILMLKNPLYARAYAHGACPAGLRMWSCL